MEVENESFQPSNKLFNTASKLTDVRTRSFLPIEGSEKVNRCLVMIILCLVASSEGMDQATFPAATDALVTYIAFDINSLAYMGTVQSIVGAISGVFWGIMASRAYLPRPRILLIGGVLQGGATIMMSFFIRSNSMLYILRGVNGFALAALRPICNSIVGDIFGDEERGRYFGLIMATMTFGNAFTTLLVTAVAKVPIIGYVDVNDPKDDGLLVEFWGWHLMFILIGAFTAVIGVLCMFSLGSVPPVMKEIDDRSKDNECQTVMRLLSMWTFCACAFQGCFGLIPWTAMSFRGFFFERAGVTSSEAGLIGFAAGITGGIGNFVGGAIGDFLARVVHQVHGRVLCAEISVYGGIPIAYFTFGVSPAPGTQFVYFFLLSSALGLVATWVAGGTNSPVLCTISTTEERALVLAWQSSLEGSIGAVGPIIFTALLGAFGVDGRCLQKESGWPDDPNASDYVNCSEGQDTVGEKAGNALFWCSCLPWSLCGLFYTSLHYSYPRDLAKVIKTREERDAAQQMATPLTM